MRSFPLVLLALALFSAPLAAQSDTAALQRKLDDKLKKEFVGKIEWARTLKEAKERAAREGKPILGYFTRSFAP
jgi:hypothetical protein